jgi:subtilisin family serine protease
MTFTSKEKSKKACLASSVSALALTVCVTVLFYLAPLTRVTAAPSDPPEHAPDRLLVKPKAGARESSVHALFSKYGAKQKEIIHQLDLRVVTVKPEKLQQTMERLRRSKHIEFVEPDWVLAPTAVPTDPYYGYEWHLPKINAPSAWDVTTGISAVTIAILDSGVDVSHPDLAPLMVPGWNYFDNNANITDVNGHGTAVAGTAAAAANNGTGIAGVAWNCRLMPLRVSDTNGYGNISAMASALTWAADHGARVANLSFSGVAKLPTVISAAQYFQAKGGVVTASAGNAGTFDPSPTNPYFLVVSATDANDVLASWSNTGSNIDLSAPGVNIMTTAEGGSYGSGSGTSFSAPIVAGAAALAISANPTLPGTQIQSILKQTADDLGSTGWDTSYGAGRLNVGNAVALAASSTPLPPTDGTAPVANITAPANSSTLSGTVTVNVTATDEVRVTSVDCYVNSTLLGTTTNAVAGFPWNTTAYANGSYTLQARAHDAAGNVGLSPLVNVSVWNVVAPPADTIAPTVVLTSPIEGATLGRSVKVSVAAADNVGVTRVDLYTDGKLYVSSTTATTVFTWNTSKLTKGTHTLRAWAYDAAGNVGSSALVSVKK